MKNYKKTKILNEGNIIVQDNKIQSIRSVDELWGIKTKSYKQNSLEEYESFLHELENNEFELRQEAARFQIPETFSKEMVVDELKKIFRAYLRRKNSDKSNIQQPVISPSLNKKLIELINS